MGKIKILLYLSLLAASGSAWAMPIYQNDPQFGFIAYYDNPASGHPAGSGTKLESCYHCTMCHNQLVANANNLTQYAMDFRDTWASLQLAATNQARGLDQNPNQYAVAALKQIEAKDDDGDGANSGAEVDAISNMGDPTSTPGSPNCVQSAPASGGNNTTMASEAFNNPNSLNARCSANPYGAGMIQDNTKTVHIVETIFMMLFPLFLLAALKRSRRALLLCK